MSENCGKCKFWKQKIDTLHDPFYFKKAAPGQCRRRAPESHLVADKWPTTKADDWCGEFEEKKT